jgi:hypothetical protein
MPIVGRLDIHRKQITFDYLDTGTGQVQRGQISPADRVHLRAWLARYHRRGISPLRCALLASSVANVPDMPDTAPPALNAYQVMVPSSCAAA